MTKPFRDWIIWAALFILPLVFYPRALSSPWVSTSDVHALLEFWASTIALIAAGTILVHFFATGRRFFLIISLAFTLQGTEDFVHALDSFSRIWPAARVGIANFIPGTYAAGRLMLIICILLACYLGKSVVSPAKRLREVAIYNGLGFFAGILATTVIINSPLPKFVLKGLISRPVDFAAAIIYLITFFLFAAIYRKEENRNPFVWSMTASIIFGFVAQVYMVHSQQLYDAQFDIAHLIKIFSYIFPILGIAVGSLGMYKKEEKITEDLRNSLERENISRHAEQELNKELVDKSQELEKQNKLLEERKIEMANLIDNIEAAKKQLESQNNELEIANRAMMGREEKVLELKKEVKELKEKLGTEK